MIAEPKQIEDIYLIATVEKLWNQDRAEISCATRNQYFHEPYLPTMV
jgi:hypothetical protein